MSGLRLKPDPNLLIGMENSDDAGVYRLTDDLAIIQTLDFFTPIVDSPYDFGLIAAANSLSDIYAMGGKPLTAMNIVCFPADDLPESVLAETLAAGLEKIHEAGATLVGGHSVDDPEFKYGLSVTGITRPDRILSNAGARPGNRLILTKPIGTGIIATAIKGNLASPEMIQDLVRTASRLNRYAADIAAEFSPTACTDITGFGLAGHVLEMARGAKAAIVIHAGSVTLMDGAYDLARMGMFPAGAYNNKNFCATAVTVDGSMDDILADIMFDPQTSGGLVIALPPAQAGPCLARLIDAGIDACLFGEVSGMDSCGKVSIRP